MAIVGQRRELGKDKYIDTAVFVCIYNQLLTSFYGFKKPSYVNLISELYSQNELKLKIVD